MENKNAICAIASVNITAAVGRVLATAAAEYSKRETLFTFYFSFSIYFKLFSTVLLAPLSRFLNRKHGALSMYNNYLDRNNPDDV